MQVFLEKYEKYTAWFFFGLMFLCLISMAALGFYNHPVGDDYHYGYGAIMAWRENGSWFEVLKSAAAGTVEQFSIWQGTYSAMFFMHIPPQVFGDFFYKLYPTVLLACFTGGFFYLTHALLCTLFKAKREFAYGAFVYAAGAFDRRNFLLVQRFHVLYRISGVYLCFLGWHD